MYSRLQRAKSNNSAKELRFRELTRVGECRVFLSGLFLREESSSFEMGTRLWVPFFSHDDFFRNEILGYLIVEPFRLDQKILENYSYDEWKEIDLFFM